MRILLTGTRGQVGWELQRTLAPLGELHGFDRPGMDLADPDSIVRTIGRVKPALIVNAAAYTAVDKAESEPALAMAVNGTAPGILAEEARRVGAALVHYSTDYVYDGAKTTPYAEEDAPRPLGTYGRSKLAGEEAIRAVGVPHFILRTSWVFSARGKNFLITMLRLATERDELRIVDDQHGAPTWCRMIAEATALMIPRSLVSGDEPARAFAHAGGTYHLSAAGRTSWHGFARAILGEAAAAGMQGLRVRHVAAISTSEYPTPAARPKNSVLSNEKLGRAFGIALPHWADSLRLCLESPGQEGNAGGKRANPAT